MISYNHVVQFQHTLWDDILTSASCIVDATAGNGHDTLYVARGASTHAKIHAIDCQQQALDATQLRLEQAGFQKERITYHLGDHGTILNNWQDIPIDILLFNLGYLPAGDHCIYTNPSSTISAIRGGLAHLAPQGLITIVAYPGTPAGKEEAEQVAAYITTLPQRQYDVCCWSPMNQANFPPVLYVIKGR